MNYKLRRVTVNDALQLPALTLAVNGPSYVHGELYHPHRIMRLNESGELISIVAIDEQEHVVGHCALERPGLGLVAEVGEAMVLPEHRHHHLLDLMRQALEEEAKRLGLVGLSGDAVTHHVYSQKTEERFHGEPTGIMLGALPASADHLEGVYPQRLSFLNCFKYLSSPDTVVYHLPPHHREIARKITQQLGRTVEFAEAPSGSHPGKLETSYAPDWQRGLIEVRQAGTALATEIDQAFKTMRDTSGAQAVFVDLPLGEPETADLCVELEKLGFFFSGLKIRDPGIGDALRLQFLSAPIDFTLLKIDAEFARELLDYIAHERDRVTATPR